MGTYKGGPVPSYVDGKKDGFLQDRDGSLAVSYLIDEQLMELAEEFGTRYHKIQNQFDSLEPVAEQIKLMSTARGDKRKEVVENDVYFILVGVSVLLLLVSMIFMPIKVQKRPPSPVEPAKAPSEPES